MLIKGEKMNKYHENLSEPSFKGKKPKKDKKSNPSNSHKKPKNKGGY